MKKNKNIIVDDQVEIEKLDEFFKNQNDKIEEKKYVSITEDRSRIVKLILRSKLKFDTQKVRKAMFSLLIKELHPDLDYSDIKENRYYRTSGKNGKIVFKVEKFNETEFNIVWYNKDQKFLKSMFVSEGLTNKRVTRIRLLTYVRGMDSIETYFERRLRGVYLQREKIAFKVSILKLKISLAMFNDNKKEKLVKKIERMIDFSKKLY